MIHGEYIVRHLIDLTVSDKSTGNCSVEIMVHLALLAVNSAYFIALTHNIGAVHPDSIPETSVSVKPERRGLLPLRYG